MAHLTPRQVGRQRLALGLSPLLGGGIRARESLEIVRDALEIRIQRFFEQAALLTIESLGLRGELQALEHRILVRELLDHHLLVAHLREQPRGVLAQLFVRHVV
jgi:hypothetical protein